MKNAARKTLSGCALDIIRGYALQDAAAVQGAVAELKADDCHEVYSVLSTLLNTTVSIFELTGAQAQLVPLVQNVENIASASAPHHEFAISEAARAWARGDERALRAELTATFLEPSTSRPCLSPLWDSSSGAGPACRMYSRRTTTPLPRS